MFISIPIRSISTLSSIRVGNGIFKTLSSSHKDYFQTSRMSSLVLIRHGESTWNLENKFTGWNDCPLSPKGVKESIDAGKLIKTQIDLHGLSIDIAHTSLLKRAIRTLFHVLDEADLLYLPVHKVWQLNERHYGSLQGLDKQQTVEKYGKDQVHLWRRSYDIPPPSINKSNPHHPTNDPRYKHLSFPTEFTESLSTTLDRVVPYYIKEIMPSLKKNKNILITAHGNSLRALVKHLDHISTNDITGLNIPTGIPLLYEFDENMEVIPCAEDDRVRLLRGKYLGDKEVIKKRIDGVKNQTK